ncbi:MAG: hypothetical protein HUJ75_07285 [Parasporobacterium sp.]|nr:hypothetical protein [Parasporobacterium sp.]
MDYENEKENEIHITREDFDLDPKEEHKRRKEEIRKARRSKFTDKKESKVGIAACFVVLFAIGCLVAAIWLATKARGNGPEIVGWLGMLGFLGSLTAVVMGLFTFRYTDVMYHFSWVAIFSGGIVWLFTTFILILGI